MFLAEAWAEFLSLEIPKVLVCILCGNHAVSMYREEVKAEKGRDETTVGIKRQVEELRFSPRGTGEP